MAENLCLMFIEAETANALVRVLSLAAAAGDLHKRTVLYVAGRWTDLALQGGLEQHERQLRGLLRGPSLLDLFRRFQSGGGQVWLSASDAQQMDLAKQPLIPGAYVVDEPTLLTFLMQDTVVLNF